MSKHAVIYVFGLGDHRSRAQQLVVRLWHLYGLEPSVFHMQWRVPDSFEAKISGLLAKIDRLTDEGYIVSLVGTSAGASAVMNAFALRQDSVHTVICICGKLRNAETIHPRTYERNPAFAESLKLLPDSLSMLDKGRLRRVLSIRSLRDGIVPPADTVIEGAKRATVPGIGHSFSIALAITVFSPIAVRFIKRT